MTPQETRSLDYRVRVWGEYGIFTRPETKSEPSSYPFITPTAAVGVLNAITWKPAMRWVVTSIAILSPIRYLNFRRNDVKEIPKKIHLEGKKDYLVGEHRTQRNRQLIYKPDYAITAHIELIPSECKKGDNIWKYANTFEERMRKGQSYHQPVLGTSEFLANCEMYNGNPKPCNINEDFGFVQVSGWFSKNIRYFHAVAVNGVINVEES